MDHNNVINSFIPIGLVKWKTCSPKYTFPGQPTTGHVKQIALLFCDIHQKKGFENLPHLGPAPQPQAFKARVAMHIYA